MKRYLTSIAALMLTIIMLAGCTAMPRGAIEGNVYTCESSELTFTAPEGWVFFEDSFKLNEHADMYVSNGPTESYVVVVYDDLAAIGKTDCDEEAYFELIMEEANKINPDINTRSCNYTDVKVGASSFKAFSLSDNGYLYLRRKGNCMICIMVYIFNGDDIDSIMANFS